MDQANELIAFRECTLEDLKDVEIIEKRSFTDPWSRSMLYHEIKNDSIAFFCLTEDSRIVGYVSIMIIFEEGFIHNLAIHPDDRGKGYGHLILKKAIDYVKTMGVEYVLLEVRKSNQAGIHLYKSNEFVEIGIRKNYYRKPEEDAIIMKWKGQIG